MEHYLFLSSTDSLTYYPENTPEYFTVNLEQSLCLRGVWKVALTDINIELNFNSPRRPSHLELMVNICQPSFIYGKYLQTVRRLYIPPKTQSLYEVFPSPYYFNLKEAEFRSVTVNVLDQNLQASKLTGEINFTLHLKRVS